MRALTVRQPWAWAIIHGGKDVENRTRNLTGSYRGPVAIHAGLQVDQGGVDHDLLRPEWAAGRGYTYAAGGEVLVSYPTDAGVTAPNRLAAVMPVGAFVGVVGLLDVHVAAGLEDDPWSWCCRPWGEPPGVLLKADGKFTGPKRHLVLANPRPLAEPIPARGALGLWTPSGEQAAAIREALR